MHDTPSRSDLPETFSPTTNKRGGKNTPRAGKRAAFPKQRVELLKIPIDLTLSPEVDGPGGKPTLPQVNKTENSSIESEVEPGWLASTYQCNSEPRGYQECSQVHEPRVRGCRFLGVAYQSPTSAGTFNPLITQLSSVLRSLKPRSRRLIRFSPRLPSNIQFLFTPEGVGEMVKQHLPFPTLDNGTLVDQQLTFLVVNPDYGKVLEFSPPPAYSGMIPKGTANVFADSDGFLGIVAVLCVKSFLLPPPR
ncbi:hypothetical protein AVEN_15402-1 [Araneus ventricosus]|uniref:Uncharacterized protein n=1 Tax=Araneus ventricosus TaxID=182803 RepID=A0A4Y2CV47_ARAVE|nr:hypothetical protein AVEN_15402-1 [Araneus ventricosus]